MLTVLNQAVGLLFLMAAGHALADRPLQEGAIRAEKYAPRGVGDPRWVYGIACHSLIHGGFVAVITGLWWLGLAETLSHAAIDEAKCRRRIGQVVDQLLHGACKVAWTIVAIVYLRS